MLGGTSKLVPSVLLSKIATKVLPFLDLPLEDLVANDQLKIELTDAAGTLDEHLPMSEVRLGQQRSEQEMVLKIEALENELAAATVGLANIRSTNEGLSTKLDRYEETNVLMVNALKNANLDPKRAQEAYAAAKKDAEALKDRRNRLKSSLQRYI
ncbi:hypothetical protein PIB30_023852 [Stylosanthes scabra]|uniref:Uncharacterized protein n=1 Tax=Stylosanthes scabra TaxID=79078 RepID=A0ABU6RA07_9FABA|nr:hypothetical protein [Stylosanthes scabra]